MTSSKIVGAAQKNILSGRKKKQDFEASKSANKAPKKADSECFF
jgi:hypothetical protein